MRDPTFEEATVDQLREDLAASRAQAARLAAMLDEQGVILPEYEPPVDLSRGRRGPQRAPRRAV
jgi:hypothetical protein